MKKARNEDPKRAIHKGIYPDSPPSPTELLIQPFSFSSFCAFSSKLRLLPPHKPACLDQSFCRVSMGTMFYGFEWSVSHEEPLQGHGSRGGGKADIESVAGAGRLAGINVWAERPSKKAQDGAYRNIFSQWECSPSSGVPALELCVVSSVDVRCRLMQSCVVWLLVFSANQSGAAARGTRVEVQRGARLWRFDAASARALSSNWRFVGAITVPSAFLSLVLIFSVPLGDKCRGGVDVSATLSFRSIGPQVGGTGCTIVSSQHGLLHAIVVSQPNDSHD